MEVMWDLSHRHVCVCVTGVCALYERSVKSSEVNLESPGKGFIKLPSSFSLLPLCHSIFLDSTMLWSPSSFKPWSLFLENEELLHILWTDKSTPWPIQTIIGSFFLCGFKEHTPISCWWQLYTSRKGVPGIYKCNSKQSRGMSLAPTPKGVQKY